VAGALTLVAAMVVVLIAYVLRDILAVLLLGVVVGTTLGPQVDALARYRLPRILSGILLYAAAASVVAVFLAYAIPELTGEVRHLANQLEQFESDYERLAERTPLPPWSDVQPVLRDRLNSAVGEVASQAGAVVTAVVYTVTVFVVGLFWTASRKSAGELFLSLVSTRHQAVAERTLGIIGRRLRHYLLAELAGMTAIGVLVYIGLTLLGMPYAFVLATLAFGFEILPILGPWLAFIPALLIALTEGWQTTILVSVLYLAIQQAESYVIVPVFQRQGTGMPELLVLVAILIGGALMGILGALIALPLAVILHVILMEVVVPWRRAQIDDGTRAP
jgi:predicted PurR-regulated permease PerM